MKIKTLLVIEACVEHKVKRLIYTSSPSVVFNRVHGIYNGDESLTYTAKAYFDTPPGDDPLAITVDSMQKGHCWINGNSIGRYWASFITPLGKPSQSEYHIPRAFLKPKKNLVVVFEEVGGIPHNITILTTVNRGIICTLLSEVLEVCKQLQGERTDSRSLARCIQELRMKGASFDLSKEPMNAKRMKSSSVEIKWKPMTWCSQSLTTICLLYLTGLLFPASRFILCV